MFSRNMKILTINTNNTSHIAHCGDGIQPITKVFNNFDNNGSEGDRVESGAQSVSNHKTNKREQKHNTRSKFILNNNNIQQSITKEQQQKPQKYHHKNNNNNNNNAKQKSQHYNSKSSNSVLSANRKKYYQQHHQQQQQQSLLFQNQQQQQHYIAAMQERIKSQINITINNNNSNLIANENYNIALHEQNYKQPQHQQQQHHQQHQQQQQQNIIKNNNTVNDSTNLLETRSCLLDQINCDKPPMPFCSTECSSSTASSLPIAKSDLNCRNQHPHITTYDNHYKSALSTTSKTDLLNDQRTTAPSASVKFSKLAEPQQLQSTTPLAKNNLNNLEEFVGNAVADSGASKSSLKRNFESTPSASPATSSPAAILAPSSDDKPSNRASHLVSENKLICKNSITSGGSRRATVAVGGDNCRTITPSFYTVGEIIESTHLSKEKEHYASVKNLITNTSKVLAKSNKKKGNDAVLVSNVITTQQKQLPKHQFPVEEKEAMTSSSVVTPSGSKSIKPAIPNCKRSTLLCSSKTTTISEEEPQLYKNEKLSNPKVVPKSISNNNNSKNDIDKTTSAFSLKSTSPQSSYSLDFLHSVGVKMTGLVLQTPETQGLTNGYGKQSESHPSVCNSFSGVTSNRKQPRHLCVGSNNSNGNTDSQHYNYHHQPSQLTIASFLHKDLLGDANLLANESNTDRNGVNFLCSSNSRNNNNCKDHQQRHYMQEQGLTRGRYHQNYYVTSYQQPSGVIPNTNFGNEMGYNRELPSLLSNTSRGAQRNLRNGYLNFRNSNGESSMSKNHNKNDQRHPRHLENSTGNYRNFVTNAQSKKKSHATSITSNASSSSLKSILSNSSNISSHKLRTMASSESNIGTSKLNLTNDTLSSKMLSSSNERINHRGHPKHNSHHYSSHNNHFMTVSPNVLQHQNYCNLTYIATSGTADGATNIGYSSALQSQSTAPASANNCLNVKSQINSPSHVPVFMSFNPNRFQFTQYHHPQQLSAQQPQHLFHKFPHQEQQNFSNKKIIVPLSLSIPSPTPSPKPIRRTANISIKSQLAMVPGNSIMSCYPFDAYAAETPDAILASTSEIVGGNDCDSDSCSNHSSTQMQYRSLTSVKSFASISPSIASLASNTSTSAQDVEQQSTYGQSMIPAATTPPRSPKDYIYTNPKSFPDVQVTQQAPLKNFHTNNNGAVVSVLNLPTKSQNIYTDEEYQQQLQQHHQRYFNAIANQRPADPLNITSALTGANNCSNNSSGNWSPSSDNNQFLYHQTNAGQIALLRSKTTSSSSGNSSISSISPPILQNDELQYTQEQPAACISSNEQLGNIILYTGSKADSGMSSNSSSASSASFNSRRIKNNSKKGELTSKTDSSLLPAKQQLLIGPQTCQSSSSNSSLLNLSDSTLTNAVQAFDEVVYLKGNLMSSKNEYSNQFQQLPQISTDKLGSSSTNGIQQLPPPPTPIQHILTFHQPQLLQSLPPASHNLLYNSPHTQHSRPLSSSIVPEFFTPPDRFLARAHLVEMKEAPSTLLNNSVWDRLSQDMWNKFIDCQQTKETFIQKMYLWRHLYLFIKNVYPRFGLYLVGSTISGFGSDSSDVDMCVVSRTASSVEPRLEALFNLTLLRDWLSKSGEFENFNLIEAKVPILRFSHRMHQLEIDLNFNNCVGIKNTHLLYCYSQLDWRVRPLVLIVKLWAQYHNINNAKNMTISSYSLVLMVIHFLQYSVAPPVLPCLHKMFPDKFPLLRSNDFGYVDMNETMRSYENENTLPIGELFSLFLEYYSLFDYTQFAISVRTGGILPISECRAAKSPKNDMHQWKILCIEEPFDLTNTARSVYDYQTFERVKVVFMNSKRILKETLDLNSVFSNVMQSYCSLGSFSILNDINPTATTDTNMNFQDKVTNTCENYCDQSRNYIVECNDKSTVDLNDANSDEIEDDTNRKLEQNKASNYSLLASENKLFVQKEFLFCTKNNRSSNQTIAPMLS